MKMRSIREWILWVSLGMRKNSFWIALGIILALLVIYRIGFRIPNPGFDADALRQATGQ